MVIIADKVGQLCNRLFQFSYFIVNGIEYNYQVINPCFDEYAIFFETTASNNFKGLGISTKITPFKKLDHLLLRFSNKKLPRFLNFHTEDIRSSSKTHDLKNVKFRQLAKTKIVFAKGWLFKDEENLKKYRSQLIEIFKPKKQYLNEVENILMDLRSKYDFLIGVHIRRGDYREWNNGRYFFDDEVYLDKMKQIEQEMNTSGKSCCFFVASNEEINVTSFKSINLCYEKRNLITDLYTLAGCDYIIGPPSTFSLWASFYGNIPLQTISSSEEKISLKNFSHY
jgi:hypothetical protein